jgi:hypothetical protein
MSNSLHQSKLEHRRQQALSRQAARRQNLANTSISANTTENVEYLHHAYDNHGAQIEETQPKDRKKKKSKKSKKPKPEVSKLIEVSDDEDNFDPALNSENKPRQLEITQEPPEPEINNNQEQEDEDDSQSTPRIVQKNEDLFNLSDASSESNMGSQYPGDDISLAGGMGGVRPQTAQSNYQRSLVGGNLDNYENIPEVGAKTASSFIKK